MHDAHLFLQALTVVMCTAGLTTVLCHRLRQPVVLGYIVAGLIVGPNVPIPLVADRQVVQTLSELGVILLMFSLGLEFSLRKLVRVGPTSAIAALIQTTIMIWLGYLVGQAFGWTTRESLFAGAIIAISSTTIIAKAFDEQGVKGKLRQLVVGILIIEDLIAILLMAVLTALSSADGVSAATVVRSGGRLAAFLAGLLIVGMLVVPRLIRRISRLGSQETTVVVSIGICFALSLLASSLGYSIALGAFLAGALIAESGREREVEHLVHPIRDMFAAIFFVSVGMLIDPALIVRHWGAIAVLTAVVIAGKVIGVSLGAFVAGNGTRTSIQAGMSLAQIGEFSFIIAALGIALGATRDFLYPVAVAVSALTTLTTPWLIRASGPAASLVDRRLPRPLQTFVALYGSWIEQLRTAPAERTRRRALRRLIRLLALDALILAAVVIGAAVELDQAAGFLVEHLGASGDLARVAVVAVAAALAAPFLFGMFSVIRRLGVVMGESALPRSPDGTLDLAAAPRRALVVTIQLAVLLAVAVPFIAAGHAFLPGLAIAGTLVVLLVGFGAAFWRTATNLHGHARAGAQVIVEALAAQSEEAPASDQHLLDEVQEILPGLGKLFAVRLTAASTAVGRSLAEIDLRGLTGAIVIAIRRGEESVVVPTARDVLRAGDVVALAGTQDALRAAAALLRGTGPGPAPDTRRERRGG